MSGFGVFEHFKAHPAEAPYRRCPDCGGELHMFRHAKRLGEVMFYCPSCDWNHTIVDLSESLGEDGFTYLDGDSVVTVKNNGFKVLANAARVG